MSTQQPVAELLAQLGQGGDATDRATLALGLLIESARLTRPAGGDGGIAALLGPRWAGREFSADETEAAIRGLIAHLQSTPVPSPGAVWALGKSYDERALPIMFEFLDRLYGDPGQEQTANHALLAIINIGMSSPLRERALETVRRIARYGTGELALTAQSYLAVEGSGFDSSRDPGDA